MTLSQNGWSVVDADGTEQYTVTKAGRRMRLRRGPAGAMLADFIRWFDEHIRDIDPGQLDEWGWAVRPVRGDDDVSNHASATAGDVDATKWPLGSDPRSYLTDSEIARVRTKLREYRGCIRWGGDYIGRKDPMHFEIDADEPTVNRVWAQIQGERIMATLDKDDLQAIAAAVWGYNLGATKGGTNENPVSIPAESAKDRLNAVRRAGVSVRDWVDDLHDGEAPA